MCLVPLFSAYYHGCCLAQRNKSRHDANLDATFGTFFSEAGTPFPGGGRPENIRKRKLKNHRFRAYKGSGCKPFFRFEIVHFRIQKTVK